MKFKKIECVYAFYDEYACEVFYQFNTVPQIDHGDWAISRGGDCAYNLFNDNITQDYPDELLQLLKYVPTDMEIEGYPE